MVIADPQFKRGTFQLEEAKRDYRLRRDDPEHEISTMGQNESDERQTEKHEKRQKCSRVHDQHQLVVKVNSQVDLTQEMNRKIVGSTRGNSLRNESKEAVPDDERHKMFVRQISTPGAVQARITKSTPVSKTLQRSRSIRGGLQPHPSMIFLQGRSSNTLSSRSISQSMLDSYNITSPVSCQRQRLRNESPATNLPKPTSAKSCQRQRLASLSHVRSELNDCHMDPLPNKSSELSPRRPESCDLSGEHSKQMSPGLPWLSWSKYASDVKEDAERTSTVNENNELKNGFVSRFASRFRREEKQEGATPKAINASAWLGGTESCQGIPLFVNIHPTKESSMQRKNAARRGFAASGA